MKTRSIVLGLMVALAIVSCESSSDEAPVEVNYVITATPEGGGGDVIHGVPTLTSGTYNIGNAREIANSNWQQLANGKLYASWGSGYKEYQFTEEGNVVESRSLAVDLG